MTRRQFFKVAGSATLFANSPFVAIPPRAGSETREPMRDVIVLIPGIMGSVLTRRGKAIWSPTAAAPLAALSSQYNDLKLSQDTSEDRDVDGVEAPELVRFPHVIPDFWNIDAYTSITDTIVDRFKVRGGENYFEFPYDWRRDNRASARKLKRLSHGWLQNWRNRSGSHDARLILVCHSMGGLIARYFLEVLEGWRDTRMLITFGTPFRGAAKALTTLANGIQFRFVPYRENLEDSIRSFTSVYQLLPYYKCCELHPGSTRVGIGDLVGVRSLDLAKIKSALNFHDEIRSSIDLNRRLPEYSARAVHQTTHHAYSFASIVGIEQRTTVFAGVESGTVRPQTLDGYDGGDGTVPRGAAIPWELEINEAEFNVSGQHSMLMRNREALEHFGGVLSGLTLSSLRSGPVPGLALNSLDAYQRMQPIEFEIIPRESAQVADLNIDVSAAGNGRTIKPMRVTKRGATFHAEFSPLAPGVYRARASASTSAGLGDSPYGALSISGLFSVF
jgi:hypothetical protein